MTESGDAMIQATMQWQANGRETKSLDHDLAYVAYRRLPTLAVSRSGRVLAASLTAIMEIGFDPEDFHLGDIEGFSGTENFESEFLKLLEIDTKGGKFGVIVKSDFVKFKERACTFDAWLNSGNETFTSLVLPFTREEEVKFVE